MDFYQSQPVELNDGSIVIAGFSYDSLSPATSCLIKFDANGNPIWKQYIPPAQAPFAQRGDVFGMISTLDGGFAVTGSGLHLNQDTWVCKLDSNGCNFSGCAINTAIAESSIAEIEVYPNPASNQIHFQCLNEQITSLVISDISGKEPAYFSPQKNIVVADISALSSGIYLYRIITISGKQSFGKFVKE